MEVLFCASTRSAGAYHFYDSIKITFIPIIRDKIPAIYIRIFVVF